MNSSPGKFVFYFFNVIHVNERNFNTLTAGHVYVTVTVLLRHFGDRSYVFGSKISSNHLQTQGKVSFLLLSHESAFFK